MQVATLILVAGAFAAAQAPQFLPEVDVYLKVNPKARVYFQAKGDRDEGAPIQSTLGPSLQLYFKPLVKLKKVSEFDLDDSKQRPLVFEAGYRYITAPNEPTDNRFMPLATFNFPMKGDFLVTDRNRADLDWKGGEFKWRYRNKLTLETDFRNPLLSFNSSDQCRTVLYEPILKMEHYGLVCGLSVSRR